MLGREQGYFPVAPQKGRIMRGSTEAGKQVARGAIHQQQQARHPASYLKGAGWTLCGPG